MKALYKGKLAPIKISFKYNVKSLLAKHNLVYRVREMPFFNSNFVIMIYGFLLNLTHV